MKALLFNHESKTSNLKFSVGILFAVLLLQSIQPFRLKAAIINSVNSHKIGINVGEWCPPELNLTSSSLVWSSNCTMTNSGSTDSTGIRLQIGLLLPASFPNPNYVYVTEVFSYGNEPIVHLPLYTYRYGKGISDLGPNNDVATRAATFVSTSISGYAWKGFQSNDSFRLAAGKSKNYRIIVAWDGISPTLPACRYIFGRQWNGDNKSVVSDVATWKNTLFNPSLSPTTQMLYHKKNTTSIIVGSENGEVRAVERCIPSPNTPPTPQPFYVLRKPVGADSNTTGHFVNLAVGNYTLYFKDTNNNIFTDSAHFSIAHERIVTIRNEVSCGSFVWSPLGGGGGTYDSSGVYAVSYPGVSPTFQPNDSVLNLVVHQLPTVTATASSSSICSGTSTTITASGADTYIWQPGNLSGASITVSPASTTTYTVTGTITATGCTNTVTKLITVQGCSVPLVIGATSGTSSIFYGPLYRSSAGSAFNFSNYAHLYTAAELSTIGGGSNITNIEWLKADAGQVTGGNNTFEVWLQNTAATSLVTGTTWGTLTGPATLVYSSNTQDVVGAANTYFGVATTPFTYTGSNLLVLCRWVKVGTASGAVNFYSNLATGLGIGFATNVATTAATPLQNVSYGDNRPTVRFTYAPGSPCAGVPSPGNTIAPLSVCPNTPFTVSLQNNTLGSGVSYQWYNNAGLIAGATNASYTTSITAADDYYCDVTCSSVGGGTTPSNIANVAVNGFLNCYCIPTTTNGCASGDHITNVTATTLGNPVNNSTGACLSASYSDYTTTIPTAQATQGDAVPISVSVNNGGTEYASAWIDYDQSGTFDAGENIVLTDADGLAPWIYTGTANIPFTALTGVTRMRFRSSYNAVIAANSACSAYSFGETEDYLINIALSTLCTGTPTPGDTRANGVAGTTVACNGTTVNLTLQNATIGTGVSYQWEDSNGPIAGATNPTYSVVASAVTLPNDYFCNVTCSAGGTGISNLVSVSLDGFINCYCAPNSQFGSSGGFSGPISNVTLGSINNTSGFPAASPYYTNYAPAAGTTTNVLPGLLYPLSVTIGQQAQTAVWIDWDQSGTFDASEFTFLGNNAGTATVTYSANINVPFTAAIGQTKMRVRTDAYFNANMVGTNACTLLGYGESEDYTITVDPLVPCAGLPAPGNTIATPATVCAGGSTTLTLQNSTSGTGVTYQWYNGAGLIAGATDAFYTATNITAADNFYCDVTCASVGGGTTSSTSVLVGLSNFLDCYCASAPSNTADEEIYQVTLNGASTNPLYANAAGCTTAAPGPGSILSRYSNFKSLGSLTTVLQGDNVPFTVAENECDAGTFYAFGTAIWIDFNQNGSFADAGEQVFVESATLIGPRNVVGNIAIPVTATPGVTAMRIIVAESNAGAALQPCMNGGAYGYGETEDYLITIAVPNNCVGAPAPGNTVASVSSVCPGGSATLSLQNNVAAIGISYQWFANGVAITGANNSTYTATNITATSTYSCEVTCSFSTTTVGSTPVTVNINSFLDCYCASSPSNTFDEEIYSVTFNGASTDPLYSNAAGCTTAAPGPGSVLSQYSNFKSLGNLTTVTQGDVVPFVVEENECDGATFYAFGTGIWIDFNHNGSFADAGEQVFVEAATLIGPRNVVGNITIPYTALTGQTAMRIIVSEGQSSTSFTPLSPCGSNGYFYGETEDFLININLAVPCTGTPTPGATVASVSTACGSASPVLSLSTPPVGFSGISYQWYANAVAVTGATNNTYSPGSISATTTYSCDVTCSSVGGGTAGSTPVTVTINPNPTVSIAASAAGLCVGAAGVTLTASGSAATYTWAPATGLSATTGSPVTATPAMATTYVVTATDGNGCTATAAQLVSVYQLPTVSTTPSASSVCAGDSVQFTTVASSLVNDSLLTTLAGGNGSSGNGFNITAATTITINAVKMMISSGTIAEVWFIPGGYTGATLTSSVGWTQLGADVPIVAAAPALTNIPVSVPLTIPAGQTYGIVVVTDGSATYTNGIGTAGVTVTASNADLSITEGWGGLGTDGLFNFPNAPRIWNGQVVYQKGSVISNYAWTPAGNMSDATIANPKAASAVTETYQVTVTDANGCTATDSEIITVVSCSTTLNLKAYIQSYWDGVSAMRAALANQGEVSTATACDSIDVELRDSTTPTTIVATVRTIINQDGTASCVFPGSAAGTPVYIAIKHRNAIETWSDSTVTLGAAPTTFDFTTSAAQAFGANQVEVSTGIWAFYSGDVVKDLAESIDLLDLVAVETDATNFVFGYFPTDLNGDGNSDLLDTPELEGNVNNFIFSAHP